MEATHPIEQQPWRRRVVVTGIGLVCGSVRPRLKSGRACLPAAAVWRRSRHSISPDTPCASLPRSRTSTRCSSLRRKRLARWTLHPFCDCRSAGGDGPLRPQNRRVNRDLVGVHIGSGIGASTSLSANTRTCWLESAQISPFFIPGAIVNLAAGHVSIRFGARGPNEATATACASSAHSIGDAFRIIERGDADAMIAGGTEAAITP